jgi:hypothetical protein
MTTRVQESRAYDARYDPTFTGPYTQVNIDPRVTAAVSANTMVSGQGRYKYFRRPIMPRINGIPPQILLAPTVTADPLKPIEQVQDLPFKNQEVQTMYRESEAQTTPFTPDYSIQVGVEPEVLLLKALTYENGGLPLGKNEIAMVEYARLKKEIEASLPPFTDEACFFLRKRLMENQELKEFKLREAEIDNRREARLEQLQKALEERDESSEFLSSQRVEAMRQSRMEEREKVLQKIRGKRIKVLRRLAHRRNQVDPVLSDGKNRDIISDYFDKASIIYAPIMREGTSVKPEASHFDVLSRTAPLDNMVNIGNLESTIPKKLLQIANPEEARRSMSKTLPAQMGLGLGNGGGRASEHRDTSAAQRALRTTKRDVEEMHHILSTKKRMAESNNQISSRFQTAETNVDRDDSRANITDGAPGTTKSVRSTGGSKKAPGSSLMSKKPKGRPTTPDLTTKENGDETDDNELALSCMLLQRLIRGRAVQNVMYQGRFRRAELIEELRSADEILANETVKTPFEINESFKANRDKELQFTTIDAMAGGTATNVIYLLAQEKQRLHIFDTFQKISEEAIKDRRYREASETGRRQKENLRYPGEEANEEPNV